MNPREWIDEFGHWWNYDSGSFKMFITLGLLISMFLGFVLRDCIG